MSSLLNKGPAVSTAAGDMVARADSAGSEGGERNGREERLLDSGTMARGGRAAIGLLVFWGYALSSRGFVAAGWSWTRLYR